MKKEFIDVLIDYLKSINIVGDYYNITSKIDDLIYYEVDFDNDSTTIKGDVHLFDLLTFIYYKK